MSTEDRNFEHSTLRERIVEHIFVGDVLRLLWQRGVIDVEILRPEFDAHGYDVVMSRGRIVRHIQLKTQDKGKVSISQALSQKPSGCVIWISLNKESLALGPFMWFGAAPGKALPDISHYSNPKRATHNSQGVRPTRKNHRCFLPLPSPSSGLWMKLSTGSLDPFDSRPLLAGGHRRSVKTCFPSYGLGIYEAS